MKVLVTGTQGQLAQCLRLRSQHAGFATFFFSNRTQLDLANLECIEGFVDRIHPDVVINTAAYTAVDAAESDEATAHAVNTDAAGALAKAAAKLDAPIVQISTDYVFDGQFDGAYTEDMPTAPRSAYGRSKLAGEQAVAAANPKHAIVRTAWVYSPYGKNFVKTMLKLGETRDQVNVVDDQFGNPTSAFDIADGLIATLSLWRRTPQTGFGERYHLTGSGKASWAEFATEIFHQAEKFGRPPVQVKSIPGTEYPTPAKRPSNSCLSNEKFVRDFGYRAPHWQESLARTLDVIFGR